MKRAESISLLLKLAAHDSDLLGFCVKALDLDDLCDDLQRSEQDSLGSLPQNYFYLMSKLARIILRKGRNFTPPQLEVAQRLRVQILIGFQEHR